MMMSTMVLKVWVRVHNHVAVGEADIGRFPCRERHIHLPDS